jgi:hypothetical protein
MPVTAPASLTKIKTEFGGPDNLGAYVRAGGLVPNHSANQSILISTTNLAISQFNSAEKNFSATISPEGPENSAYLGYFVGPPVDGGINRTQVGISRSNTNTHTLTGSFESYNFDFFTFNFDFFYEILFDGFISDPSFFSALNVTSSKGSLNLPRASAWNGAGGVFADGWHRWQWYIGTNDGSSGFLIAGAGSHNIEIVYSGG